MGVLFNNIPGNIRVPFMRVEFRSGGTPYQQNARLLLVGQKLSTGDAVVNQPVMVRDGIEDMLFGVGSMLSSMYRIARRNAPLQEIWALPVADLSGGTAATGTITVATAPLGRNDVLTFYVAGRRIRTGVLSSDTNNAIAANVAAAINAETDLPVTASVASAVVTLTARHKGTLGNAIQIDTGDVGDDGPLGKAMLTIVAMADGAGDPDLQTAFGNLGDDEYDFIAGPYADTTNLGRAEDLLNDSSGRWSYVKQIYGHYFCTHVGDASDLQTLGNSRNSQHVTIFPCYKFRSTPYDVAAALGAIAAMHLQDAPELSRPLQTLEMAGIKGPLLREDRLTQTDRQSLYFDGISGYYIDRAGAVRIERVVTTYQANAWGDADWTYLDVETMFQSIYGIRYLRTKVTQTHGRQALADTNPAGLPHIATPDDVRNTVLHGYNELIADGVFENYEGFRTSLTVERDNTDANRINVEMNLDHVNQLRIIAAAAVNWMQLAYRQPSAAA